ncbi:MFS transporter [Amycolatopsis sp. YIM 10]|uniref:MFS transporter n=1 Tax=Amycolatopsis sp. YIM 10 TaxID=2653857 RepID=UPI0012900AB9|nr:MFS transporter [Amycolatopsis sp. YIM 10]QFU89298.1 enterobactin exporter EntS [Amycolatopsis sp. YIM 10]
MTDSPPEAVPETGEAPVKSLWHNADFLKFWTGETISLYGSQISMLALPLTAIYVFDATAEEIGWLRFLQLAPFLAFAMLFGALVDRMRRKPVMVASNAVRMVLIGLVPALAWAGMLDIGPLFVIAFLIGVASVFFDLSWMAYLPVLIKDRRLMVEANAKLGITASSSDAAGPSVAGVLVSVFTAPFAMLIDAISYLASLVALLMIKAKEPRVEPPAAGRHLWRELVEGLRFVFGHRHLRAIAVVGVFVNFSITGVSAMFIVYAVRDRAISAVLLGVIFSLAAIGGIIGSIAAPPLLKRVPVGGAYRLALSLIFVAPVLIPLAPSARTAAIVFFVGSFLLVSIGLGISNVLVQSLRQNLTPNSLMGRMSAAMRMALFGGGAIGGPVAGAIATWWDLRTALWFLSVLSVVMLIPLMLSPVGRLRTMPTTPPED